MLKIEQPKLLNNIGTTPSSIGKTLKNKVEEMPRNIMSHKKTLDNVEKKLSNTEKENIKKRPKKIPNQKNNSLI
jgi:hypothetical protein